MPPLSKRLRLGGQARARRSLAEAEQLRDPPAGSSHEITTPVDDLATQFSSLLSELESLKAQVWAGAQAREPKDPMIGEPDQLDALDSSQAREDLRARAEELRRATAAVAAAVDRLTAALDAVKEARSA